MIRQNKRFTQDTPAMEWRIPLPLKYEPDSIVVEVVRNTEKQSIQPEYDKVVEDELVINFGLESEAGSVWYSWLESADQTVTTDGFGNTVNITIAQQGGGTPSGASFS